MTTNRKTEMRKRENERKDGHLYIVFSMEHYNPLGIVRSLGENGIYPIAIIIRGGRSVTSKSKYISKIYFAETIEEGYEILLTHYGEESKKPFVYTSDDKITSFLDERYEDIVDKFYFFNAGAAGRLAKYMDKYNICQMAEKHGLCLADTVAVERGTVPKSLKYPIITKSIASTVGGWKKDVFICRSAMELEEAFKKIQSPRVLLQSYVEKKNELEYYGFCVNHGQKTFISIGVDYKYQRPGTYSHYMNICTPPFREIQQGIADIMRDIQFEGIFSCEFVVDENDEKYFMEINFRNATWSYASTCAGMNLPVLWAEAMKTGNISADWQKDFETFDAMVEPDDLRYRVKGHRVGVMRWIREVRGCKCLYYLNRKDMKPVYSYILRK